jgi:hypothetical protein
MAGADLTPKSTRRTVLEWRPAFLTTLRNTGNIRAACQTAGISRQLAYDHRARSQEFAAQWDEALQDAIDGLEAVAINRARTSSDTLLIFLLKAHRPEKYRETINQHHTITPGTAAQLTDDALEAELKKRGLE